MKKTEEVKTPRNRKGCPAKKKVDNVEQLAIVDNDNEVIDKWSGVKANRSDVIRVPMVKVSPNRMVCYTSTEFNTQSFRAVSNRIPVPSLTGSRPHPSKKTSRIIRDKVNWFLMCTTKKRVYDSKLNKSISFQLTFVTLTLSSMQCHTNNELKSKLLNQFLIEIKKKYGVENYIWRYEPQCNLNAHYHLILDSYINAYELRYLWNRIQNKLGYVDRYRAKMKELYKQGFRPQVNKNDKRSIEQQKKAYEFNVKSDWSQPNSTDIHSIYNIDNLGKYLGKYFSKKEARSKGQVKRKDCPRIMYKLVSQKSVSDGAMKFLRQESGIGRIWGCSVNLSKLKGVTKEMDNQVKEVLDKVLKDGNGKRFDKEFFSVYFFDISLLNKKDFKVLFNWIFAYIIETIGYESS